MVYLGTNKLNDRWLGTTLLGDKKVFPPLLDIYPATAAYSTGRQLRANQTYAMWIRRELDNAETGIGFDANGDTDESAIASFCGTSDGFVPLLVDATGNGYDAVQPTATLQPKIYDGATTSVILENGKVGIYFEENSFLTVPNSQSSFSFLHRNNQQGSLFCIITPLTNQVNFSAFFLHTVTASALSGFSCFMQPGFLRFGVSRGVINTSAVAISNSFADDGNCVLYSAFVNESCSTFINNLVATNAQSYTNPRSEELLSHVDLHIGGRNTSGIGYEGKIQEIIIYDSNELTNRGNIENNINNYYSIY